MGDDSGAAMRTGRGILEKAQLLGRFLNWVSSTAESPIATSASCRYGRYRIANLVEPGRDIAVLGVFHERLDIRRYLGR